MFYTRDELKASIDTGFKLTDEELAKRMSDSFQTYLASDTHERFVQTRLQKVLEQYPTVIFDEWVMRKPGDTVDEVKYKFDALRAKNMDSEEMAMSKTSNAEAGRIQHLNMLGSFYWAYIAALGQRDQEITNLKTYIGILNDDLGYYTSPEDIPRLFAEGVGKAVGGIATFVGGFVDDVIKGAAKGLGIDPKYIKIIIIVVAVIAVAGFAGVIISKVNIARKAKADDR